MHRFYLERLDVSHSDDVESRPKNALFSNTSAAVKLCANFR